MAISTHNPMPPSSAFSPVNMRPSSRTAQSARLKQSCDPVQFTGKQPRQSPRQSQRRTATTNQAEASFFSRERFTGAWRSLKQDLTSKDWWLKNGAIAGAVTLATCWMPGSQLFTIPLWLGIDAMLSAIKGHQQYQDFSDKPIVPAPPKSATQTPEQKQWSGREKRSAAWKGLKKGVKDGFRHNFQFKALLSGGLCLATCWLPGSQLLLIPSLFCTFAAWEGVKNAFEGYQNPETYLAPTSQQAGKTQTK